jgi:hypothetical protein
LFPLVKRLEESSLIQENGFHFLVISAFTSHWATNGRVISYHLLEKAIPDLVYFYIFSTSSIFIFFSEISRLFIFPPGRKHYQT